jgi:hypothetical protein
VTLTRDAGALIGRSVIVHLTGDDRRLPLFRPRLAREGDRVAPTGGRGEHELDAIFYLNQSFRVE